MLRPEGWAHARLPALQGRVLRRSASGKGRPCLLSARAANEKHRVGLFRALHPRHVLCRCGSCRLANFGSSMGLRPGVTPESSADPEHESCGVLPFRFRPRAGRRGECNGQLPVQVDRHQPRSWTSVQKARCEAVKFAEGIGGRCHSESIPFRYGGVGCLRRYSC